MTISMPEERMMDDAEIQAFLAEKEKQREEHRQMDDLINKYKKNEWLTANG